MVRACVHPFFSLLLPAHISLSLSRFNSWTRQKSATLLPNWLFANISNQMSSVQGQTTTKEGIRLVEDRAKKTPEKNATEPFDGLGCDANILTEPSFPPSVCFSV